jgi:transposase
MRFVGIDIGAEKHFVAIVNERGEVQRKPTPFAEDSDGYRRLRELLGAADDVLVAMEATGHYWQNLFAFLASEGFRVALLNPLRTNRFAGEDLRRAKTDAIDALGIARFAQQKRPTPTALPDQATQELRELVRLRDRLMQDLGDRTRQLHRTVDLTFPEFTKHVSDLASHKATALLAAYPTAQAFRDAKPDDVANLKTDGRHTVGSELATALCEAAKQSVGRHEGAPYRLQATYACEDIGTLRQRIKKLDVDINASLEAHDVGKLLTTIDGIGPNTAARMIAEVDLAAFRDAGALAAYIGVVPAVNQSGKRMPQRGGLCSIGHARLRAKLWMPTLRAVRTNAWLRRFYEGLVARGKPKKLALIAAMRKLLGAILSVARRREAFVPRIAEVSMAA